MRAPTGMTVQPFNKILNNVGLPVFCIPQYGHHDIACIQSVNRQQPSKNAQIKPQMLQHHLT